MAQGWGALLPCYQGSHLRWDPSVGTDDGTAPVAMFVNSNELIDSDFHLVEVRPLQLDSMTHGGRRTRDVAVRKLQVV